MAGLGLQFPMGMGKLRATGMLGMALAIAGCSTPMPPRVTASGALPTGPAARVTLIENPAGEALLPATQVAACLASLGLRQADPADTMVQTTVAIRPANSTLLVGAQAEGPPAVTKSSHRARGERILYTLIIDRLSDGARVYDLTMDMPYRAKRSTPEARVGELCSGLSRKLP